MYSNEISEPVDKDQIKDSNSRSKINEAVRQILSHYGRHHALGITGQTIEGLSKVEGEIVVDYSRMPMLTVASRSSRRLVVQGYMKNTRTLTKLCTAFNIYSSNMIEDILDFIRYIVTDDQHLPADPTELGLLPVEGFAQLGVWYRAQ